MENNYERSIPIGCTLNEYRRSYASDRLRKRRNMLCWFGYVFCALGLIDIALGPLMLLDTLIGVILLAVYHKTLKPWVAVVLAIYSAFFLQTLEFVMVGLAITEYQVREEHKAMMAVQHARNAAAQGTE